MLIAACSSGEGPGSSTSGGNGEAAKTPTQIAGDAWQATGAAVTVQIIGKATAGGTLLQVDIVDGHGHGGGTITEDGKTFHAVLDGGTIYLEADAATWAKAADAAEAHLLAGKWVKTTAGNQDFGNLAGILDISQFVSLFDRPATRTKGRVTSVDGVPVVPVIDHEPDGGTLYVANKGIPYVIALTGAGSSRGTIYFTKYGTAKIPPDPSGAVDLSTVHG